MIPPIPPMKLLMPLACERVGRGGDVGEERDHRCAPQGHAEYQRHGAGDEDRRIGASGTKMKAEAATGMPVMINGMRRPMRVRTLSENAPMGGCMNSAAILSSVMKNRSWPGPSGSAPVERGTKLVVDHPYRAESERAESEKKYLSIIEFHEPDPFV